MSSVHRNTRIRSLTAVALTGLVLGLSPSSTGAAVYGLDEAPSPTSTAPATLISTPVPASVSATAICPLLLGRFRQHLLTRVRAAKMAFRRDSRCISGDTNKGNEAVARYCDESNDKHLGDLADHRTLLRRLRGEVAKRWLAKQPHQELVDTCVDRSGPIALGENSRILKLRPGMADDFSCQTVAREFASEIANEEIQALAAPEGLGSVSAEEKVRIAGYRNSAVGFAVQGDATNYRARTNEEDVGELTRRLREMSGRVAALETNLVEIDPSELYLLYRFRTQYTRFVATELTLASAKAAETCAEEDGWFRDCFGQGDGASCADRIGAFIVDVVPVLSAIDAYLELPLNRAARDAGIQSGEEYAAEAGNLVFQGLTGLGMGIPGGQLVGKGTRPALSHVFTSAVRRAATAGRTVTQAQLRNSYRLMRGLRPVHRFVKEQGVVAYRIPDNATGLADIPASIRNRLGTVDRVTGYTDELITKNRGSHIVLQAKKDGTADFYISSGSSTAYQTLATQAADAPLLSQIRAITGDGVELTMIRKKEAVKMMRASDLGIDVNQKLTIEAPWGGTQVKEAGKDAFLVIEGDKLYIANIDEATGLPIAYVLVPSPAS